MNNNYVKCPVCDLNYMHSGERCCEVCDPKAQGRLISTAAQADDEYRYTKLQEYDARKRSMEAYRAYRWNRAQRR
ncbi:hypothetical protein FACS1894211_08810 [Clostridia bacterium]|nr:hypothetical protein FACS1894211_08810 [Clostridia bacterium]